MPMVEPRLPPIRAIIKRVASGVRHLCLIALFLSIYIEKKPIIVMIDKYAISIFVNDGIIKISFESVGYCLKL